MPSPRPMLSSAGPAGGAARGTWMVAGLLLLGVAAAVTGVWFQRAQTRRCLEFYGPAQARRIAAAPTVELLLLQGKLPGDPRQETAFEPEKARQPGGAPGRLTASKRIDVSKAPGLVHLRRGLVEDANFRWEGETMPERLPTDSWDVAFVFIDDVGSRSSARSGERGSTTLVLDLDPADGHLAVVGQPGRVGLGRIGPGLEKWIRSTLDSAR